MINKDDKVIAYRRVSSDEQAKGYSLDVQETTFENFRVSLGFTITMNCSEDASAKTFNRPEIKKIKAFIKENRGLVTKFLVTKWDRFSRNATEAYAEIAWFNNHGIEVNALEQPIDFAIPEQKMMLALYLAAPEVENLRRGANVKAGIQKARLQGRWVTSAPYGYSKILDKFKKPELIKNEFAPYVVKAFELYASGNYSQREALKIMNKKGMKIGRSQFSRILNNVAYIGKVPIKADGAIPAQIVDGLHEALITEDVFDKVQLMLTGKKTVAAGSTRAKKDELPLRGFIECKTCGKKLTGSASRGNGGRYFYYHCHFNCKGERYGAETVNKSFVDLLGTIQTNTEVSELYYEVVRDILKTHDAEREAQVKKLDVDIERQKQRIEDLNDLYIDKGITPSVYNQTVARYDTTYNNLIMQRTELSMVRTEYDKYLKWGFVLVANLKEYYQQADVTVKQQIVGSIFTDMFVIEQNNVRTTSMNEMIALITRIDAGFKEKKCGQSNLKLKLSAQAERKRFELSKHFHAYTLSRCGFSLYRLQ